jgi:glycosyltransferase involved in cell wall biosynthesis
MKICFYNVTASYIFGGLETYCWEVGRALAGRGHEVAIFAGNRGAARSDEVRLIQFPFRPEKEWPDLGVRFRRLAERLSFARNSLGPLIAGNFDAVVVNKPFDFPILWQARRQGLRAQTVFRSGGTDFFPTDRWFAPAIDLWISCSRYNAQEITAHYGRPVSVLHNGVDAERFRPIARQAGWRAARHISEGALLVASLGRLVGWKGLRTVIEALAGLGSDVQYLVIGEGPDEHSLKTLAVELGVGARVHFMGRITREHLPQLLSEADLLVQPSIGVETFGISVVEAMACALPVFASNIGGLPEIIVDAESGRLLPPRDVAAWRNAFAAAAADRATLRSWGEAGRIRVQREFSWTRNAARLEEMLVARRWLAATR